MPPILLSLVLMIVAIYFLALITDEFFIESLDQIAKRLKMPNNVAGASLMAMGSSAPELAIALFALFKQGGKHSDVGIGTIVGSAVFNILVITGISAIVRTAEVTWKVVLRDCIIYVTSILLLLVTFQDGRISALEAGSFLGLYALYLFILMQWNRFFPSNDPDPIEAVEDKIAEAEAKPRLWSRFQHLWAWLIRLLTGDPRQNYIRTFLVSIALIAGLSSILVDHAVLFSEAIGIPPVIVALTILAAGTSAPDLIASAIVAKQGRGDMAIANAIGSNIFDILIGLGLPWLLAIGLRQAGWMSGSPTIEVGIAGLWMSALILLGTVVVLFLFLARGRKLTRHEGIILLLMYVAFVAWTWMGR